jgi:hypothetical protein
VDTPLSLEVPRWVTSNAALKALMLDAAWGAYVPTLYQCALAAEVDALLPRPSVPTQMRQLLNKTEARKRATAERAAAVAATGTGAHPKRRPRGCRWWCYLGAPSGGEEGERGQRMGHHWPWGASTPGEGWWIIAGMCHCC